MDHELVRHALRQYGDTTLAFTSQWSRYYVQADIGGFIPFELLARSDGRPLVAAIGDPIAHCRDYGVLITRFLGHLNHHRQGAPTLFALQVGQESAEAYRRSGYCATHMGFEVLIHLPRYQTRGKSRAKVRRWLNSACNAGLRVRELPFTERHCAQLLAISAEWLQTRPVKEELQLILRGFQLDETADLRLFGAFDGAGEMQGFVIFDPLYAGQRVIGYYANILRYRPQAPNGTSDLIIHTSIEQFRHEALALLSLGLCPLADVRAGQYEDSIIRRLFQLTYKYGSLLYPFQNVHRHKAAYIDPEEEQTMLRPTYFVSPGRSPIRDCLDLCKAIGIIPAGSYRQMFVFWLVRMLQGCAYAKQSRRRSSQ